MDDPGSGQHSDLYRPLASDQFTRVFELEAGEFSDPIVGWLSPQAKDGSPYEAVSYVWGDPAKRHDITVDGRTMSVTANLHGALTALRHRPSGGNVSQRGPASSKRQPVRRLWADAICINQQDQKERVLQVELMSHIFAGAIRVLCWLGWEEGEEGRRHTQDAIRFIHDFMDDPQVGLDEARILLEHHDYLADPAEDLSHLSDEDRRHFEVQARKWEAVKFFFGIEYFHRTWIVQELGLARQAVLLTALKPTEDSSGIDFGALDIQRRPSVGGGFAVVVDRIDWPVVGRFVEFLDYSGASIVTHIGLLSWVAHHIVMVWATKEDGSPDCDFLTSMHWSRILRVTDPRDRVFGLLGHPMAMTDGELVVHADYTRTRGVIYTKLAANIIMKTKSLYAVSLVDHEHDPSMKILDWDPKIEGRMPSWVPDWESINRTTPLDYPVDAAITEDPAIDIEGPTDGEIGTPLPHLLVRGWIIDEVSAVGHQMETTDFPITNVTRELAKKNPFWLDRVWEMISSNNSVIIDEKGSDLDALSLLESLSLALPLGTREKGEPVGKAGLNQPSREHQKSFAAYVLEYHELLHGALAPLDEATQINSRIDLPARSVLDNLPPEARLEISRRAEEATSGGFVECMTWPSMCRVIYCTTTGLVGIGSRITRAGDLVCRVQGSAVLMTLRRIDQLDPVGDHQSLNKEHEANPVTRCVHIAPTVVPVRMQRGVTNGAKHGETAARFCIL